MFIQASEHNSCETIRTKLYLGRIPLFSLTLLPLSIHSLAHSTAALLLSKEGGAELN